LLEFKSIFFGRSGAWQVKCVGWWGLVLATRSFHGKIHGACMLDFCSALSGVAKRLIPSGVDG